MSSKLHEFPLIDDQDSLRELVQRIADTDLYALDTEFIREQTYYPELCVLQIATDETIAAVDCLADIDLDLLLDALLVQGKTWLLHSARQDLEVIFNRKGKLAEKLIDTQIGTALLGYPLQIGLQGLLKEVLGVAIEKEHTRADWSRRPLPAAVLSYALDDVRYLLPAWRELEGRLQSQGRLTWFEEDCDRQLKLPIEPDAVTILERTKGTGSLRGKQRAAALALTAWREERAKQRNRPRRWILADDQLARIAVALPESEADLQQVPDLPPKLVARSGQALISVVQQAEPTADLPDIAPPDKSVVKSLQSEVKTRAEALGIQPELLATRRDIVLAASGQSPATFTTGWRQSVLGDLA